MPFIKYRGAKHVPVTIVRKVKRHGKTMDEVRTTRKVGSRRKGSIDYRSPDKVHGGRSAGKRGAKKTRSTRHHAARRGSHRHSSR